MEPIKKEVERTWNDIPIDGRDCMDYTETYYHQYWPFNSYIDESKETIQELESQVFPPLVIIDDIADKDYAEAIKDFILGGVDPSKVLANTITFLISKLGFKKKKKTPRNSSI